MTSLGRSRASSAATVVYVYGAASIAREHEPAQLQLDGIMPGVPVHRLVHGSLMAFGSTVPSSQFGATEIRSAIADPDWLRDRVLAHQSVLEKLRGSYELVPFRFGTIYRDISQVKDSLARHEADLMQALDRVRNASEWGVKLYCDPEALRRQIEVVSADVRQLLKTMMAAGTGAQFFLRKKYGKALDDHVAETSAICIEQSRRQLGACARDVAQISVQAKSMHGRSEDMVMNDAYLVDEDALGKFHRALNALQADFAAHGFSYEVTGPWPAYHFVSLQQEGVEDGAASGQ